MRWRSWVIITPPKRGDPIYADSGFFCRKAASFNACFRQLTVILLLISQGVMDIVSADTDVARTIAACNQQMWQAYLEKNVVGHNAILSEDYTSIHPDGSLHNGPPSAAVMASEPIAAFRFSQFRVSLLAEDAALATYIADVDTPPGTQPAHVRFAAGTVWLKRRGQWKCRFYQGTTVTNEISTK